APRARRPGREALDRRRRRPRLGARPDRPLRRGTRLLEAGAAPRHARLAQVLPPRDDREVPRSPLGGARLVHACAPPQSAVLGPLVAGRPEAGAMKRALALLAGLAALAFCASAAAHPLGNFTINRFSRVEVSGHRLYVRYVLDMAEIPTFQARQAGGIDAGVYAGRIAAGA